jgi:hypothetical protein
LLVGFRSVSPETAVSSKGAVEPCCMLRFPDQRREQHVRHISASLSVSRSSLRPGSVAAAAAQAKRRAVHVIYSCVFSLPFHACNPPCPCCPSCWCCCPSPAQHTSSSKPARQFWPRRFSFWRGIGPEVSNLNAHSPSTVDDRFARLNPTTVVRKSFDPLIYI